MTTAAVLPPSPRFLVCCDWGREASKRAVYVADTRERWIRPAGVAPGATLGGDPWTFRSALDHARVLAREGSVLLAFDVPLGIPTSYFAQVRREPQWSAVTSFVDWLPRACRSRGFLDEVAGASAWSVARPFFRVPAGAGALNAFRARASLAQVNLLREVEMATRAKPVFITSGIPGTVGSGAKDLWQGIAQALEPGRDFALWPFEGTLETLLAQRGIVVGEIYPRAAYAVALRGEPAAQRAPLGIAKTVAEARRSSLLRLHRAAWLPPGAIADADYQRAADGEDAFDALLTAAALLRCVLEGTPLSDPRFEDPVAEGGILCTGAVNLSLREETYRIAA